MEFRDELNKIAVDREIYIGKRLKKSGQIDTLRVFETDTSASVVRSVQIRTDSNPKAHTEYERQRFSQAG